jgi:hypothetical protein
MEWVLRKGTKSASRQEVAPVELIELADQMERGSVVEQP